MTSTRPQLRRLYRQRRLALTHATRRACEQAIHTRLAMYPRVAEARVVAAYVAADGEVDVQPWYRQSRHGVVLPRVLDAKLMTFHTWDADLTMVPNRYGINEPAADTPAIASAQIELCLLPLVSFDEHGSRLGMGGGYYDRFLGVLERRPYLLGVAFECQCHDGTLPRADWDVPLDAVVTEDRMLEFPTQSTVQ